MRVGFPPSAFHWTTGVSFRPCLSGLRRHPPGLEFVPEQNSRCFGGVIDIHLRDDLTFPKSLPEFQRQFPNDAACAVYLERTCWPDGFMCRHIPALGRTLDLVDVCINRIGMQKRKDAMTSDSVA